MKFTNWIFFLVGHPVHDIGTWMSENKLKLNNEKSEFFIASSAWNANKVDKLCVEIGGNVIQRGHQRLEILVSSLILPCP